MSTVRTGYVATVPAIVSAADGNGGNPPRGIVTPEAVLLEFETAGVGSRLLPAVIDVGIQFAIVWLLVVAVGILPGSVPDTVGVVAGIVLLFAVMVGYPVVCETFWRGKTVGKSIFGLRVVTREGAPVRFRHSAIRGVLRIFEVLLLLGAPAVLAATFSRDNQRLGDLAAGTIVIREGSAERSARVVSFPTPYGYERYVASLDVGGLSPAQYGLIRSFLLRAAELTPPARSLLAVRLANPVARRLSHTPPPALDPEMFLLSVAAAYQQRHSGGPFAGR
jgi:uncharacterized RDD family membrane protein YckC